MIRIRIYYCYISQTIVFKVYNTCKLQQMIVNQMQIKTIFLFFFVSLVFYKGKLYFCSSNLNNIMSNLLNFNLLING